MGINIQKQIAMLRKRNNMTQAELAEKLSISYQAVSQWENGNTFPDITMLPEIAKIFNVSIDALFNEENSSNIDLSFPFKVKDDTLYVVVSKGNKVLTMNEANKIVRDNNFSNDEKIVVNIKGEVLNVQSALSLKCENVYGDVKAAGSVHCQNIGGNAACGGSIHCNDIGQNAASGGSLHARNVNGKVSAGGSVKIGNID